MDKVTVFDDVRVAQQYIEQPPEYLAFGQYSFLYNFATENIDGYFSQLDFQNRSVLTVAGSGDQAINAVLHGARKVDCFDMNRFTKYYLMLKRASILTLSYEEYISFLFKQSTTVFHLSMYERVRKQLEGNDLLFWDSLFSQYRNFQIRNGLFYPELIDFECVQRFNSYLYFDTYSLVQKQIDSVVFSFQESLLQQLPAKLTDSYDVMLFSNISDYIEKMYTVDGLRKYKELMLNLSKSLTPDGKMIVGYIYGYKGNQDGGSFQQEKTRTKVFPKQSFYPLVFESYRFRHQRDAVIVYQKKKK